MVPRQALREILFTLSLFSGNVYETVVLIQENTNDNNKTSSENCLYSSNRFYGMWMPEKAANY
jgi:hypothetical protein